MACGCVAMSSRVGSRLGPLGHDHGDDANWTDCTPGLHVNRPLNEEAGEHMSRGYERLELIQTGTFRFLLGKQLVIATSDPLVESVAVVLAQRIA